MPFYIFNLLNRPEYPPKPVDSPSIFNNNNNREVSFNMSESFFQIPASLTLDTEESETYKELVAEEEKEEVEQTAVFYVPETQYTPYEPEELRVNVTADQSVLIPSITSVLEASARSAMNHRRKSGHFYIPFHQRVVDKLDMPSQNPNSPLNFNSKMTTEDLTEDSLLMALDSGSVILFDEKMELSFKEDENENLFNIKNKGNRDINILPPFFNKNHKTKFSLDFLNTPPLNQANFVSKISDFDNNERIPTQVLIDNLKGDTQLTNNHDISQLSIDRNGNYDPLDLLPNTPTETKRQEIVKEDHDAILFPDSFDEFNNPFLTSNPFLTCNDDQAGRKPPSDNNNMSMSRGPSPVEFVEELRNKPNASISNFEARLLSSISTSPPVNPQEFGPKRIVLSARSARTSKPAPLTIKSNSSSSSSIKLLSSSMSNDNVSASPAPAPVHVPDTLKKSLGIRLKRVQFTKTSSVNPIVIAPVTPSKPDENTHQEEKYLNHILRTENKRITTILAEPRKTPIAGIKQSSTVLTSMSPAFKSRISSISGTPSKNKSLSKSSSIKEESLASYYTDSILSSPSSCLTPKRHGQGNGLITCKDSPLAATVPLDSASNINFRENQWIFFRNGTSFLVGAVCAKTSKTREIWRVKQSNGTELTVSASEMCPVAFLRPIDEVFLRTKKGEQVQIVGPFKFKRFSPQNSLIIELLRENSGQLYDCLKLTRVSIEKETFLKIRDRFDRGCIEDSQIRDQIINLSLVEEESSDHVSLNDKEIINQKKLKKRLSTEVNIINNIDSLTPKRARQQQQIFKDLKFLITVGDNKEDTALKSKYTRLIESHGGELLNNLPNDPEITIFKTFLLSNGFKRTSKFMTAIIRGIPRVHFNWIEACCNQLVFIDPTNFSNFLIEPPTGCKPTGPLFKGKKFVISGSAKFKNSWISVVRLLGGTVSNNSGALGNNLIVLTENIDANATNINDKKVNVDWLIRCVVEKTFL